MKYCRSILFAANFLLASVSGAATTTDLFIPVTGTEAANIESENDYFLRKHRYFSKRARLVLLDGRALELGDTIVISLFDGNSLTVAPSNLNVDGRGSSLFWSGIVTEPSVPVDELMTQGLTREQAQSAHASLFKLSFAAVRYVNDKQSRTIRLYDKSEKIGVLEDRIARSKSDLNIFYAIDTQFVAAKLGAEYKLIPLEMSPGYHVLIEIDDQKRISEGPFDDPANPSEGIKRQQYRDFLEALGPDPRDAQHMRDKAL